jgi:hypothetical protein
MIKRCANEVKLRFGVTAQPLKHGNARTTTANVSRLDTTTKTVLMIKAIFSLPL